MRRIPRSSRVFSYSAEHEPAARLAPGETVLVETTNAFGDQRFEPGDTLAVTIKHIEPIGTGVQGVIPDFGILEWKSLPLHFFTPEDGTIKWLRGIEFPIRPSLGAIGVAPEVNAVPSIWPGDHGGNM